MPEDARRYHTAVDLSDKNSSITQLILLTGRNKSVLEAGPATGYISEALRERGCQVTAIEKDPAAAELAAQFCERMVLGDIEEIDLSSTFAGDQFDVVMFGDVLEHLVDPKAVLEKVRPLLRKGGYVVASIPNIAHGSVRLMLLEGKFAYTERGLLDHTHLRFFTKTALETLFQEAGYSIRTWRRTRTEVLTDPHAEGISPPESELPSFLVEALREDPEAMTYQFVVRAYRRRTGGANAGKSQRTYASEGGLGGALSALSRVDETLEQQARDIARMKATLAEKEATLIQKDDQLAMRDELLGQKDALMGQKDALLGQKDIHIANIEASLQDASAQASAAFQQIDQITNSVGYRLLERVRRRIRWLAPEGSRRGLAFIAFRRGLNLIATRGLVTFFGRLIRFWEWLPDFRRGAAAVERPKRDDQYQIWLEEHSLTPGRAGRIRRAARGLSYKPLISIIMPVFNPEPGWLRDAVGSVRAQLYENWELCMADDGSTRPGVSDLLEEYARSDQRIKVTLLEKNQGISAASNAAISLATGEFIGLLDNDDELKPDALFEVVKLLNKQADLDYIYSDEDKREPDSRLVEPFFKPDWSPDLLMSANYVSHFSVYRREIVDRAGGFRTGYDGSQDYDLVLRVTELTDKVASITKPLYTWRKSPGSAASSTKAKSFAYSAAKRALKDALARRGLKGSVVDGIWKGSYRVKYKILGKPKVTIVIPTRDRVGMLRRCIESINKKSTYRNYEIMVVDNDSRETETIEYLSHLNGRVIHYPHKFNYAKVVNLAAQEADCDFLIFLNNDTEVISADWIEAMLEHGQRPEVAAVGARLLFPDGRVQHEGVIMGLGGGSAANADHDGYFGLGEVIRNCTAVTAACMLTRPSVFHEMNGFDERLGVAFNDVDFCLRAREKGYRIVYTPFALLYHHESATRGSLHPVEDEKFFRNRWGKPGEYRDPYYNPNLDLRRPFSLRL